MLVVVGVWFFFFWGGGGGSWRFGPKHFRVLNIFDLPFLSVEILLHFLGATLFLIPPIFSTPPTRVYEHSPGKMFVINPKYVHTWHFTSHLVSRTRARTPTFFMKLNNFNYINCVIFRDIYKRFLPKIDLIENSLHTSEQNNAKHEQTRSVNV